MTSEKTIELDAELAGLDAANEALDNFALAHRWPEPALFPVRLALEEVLMNVITHGSDGTRVPRVRIRFGQTGERFVMEIADDGIAFDPLDAPEPDLEADLDDRPIGGLGVYLVRQLMDSVNYHHEGGRNVLTVSKAITPQA